MKRSVAMFVLGLFAAAPAANADLSYSYLQGLYAMTEADTSVGEQDAAGPEITGSYEILSFLHVFGTYQFLRFDDFDVDVQTLSAGAGVNFDFSDHQSVFFNLAAVTTEADAGIGTADDDGYFYSIGYRETNNQRLEFSVSADHIELSDSDFSDTSISASLQYRITGRLKFEGGVNFLGQDSYLKLGVRYYLPSRFDRARNQ